jgi:hypothetical protein
MTVAAMNSQQPATPAASLRPASIALLLLCSTSCGGGDAIGLATPSRAKDPPQIQPIGITPRVAVRDAPGASAVLAHSGSDLAPAAGSSVAGLTGESLVDTPTDALAAGPDASAEASSQGMRNPDRHDDPSDDGSEVTPMAVDEFGALQPDPAVARR